MKRWCCILMALLMLAGCSSVSGERSSTDSSSSSLSQETDSSSSLSSSKESEPPRVFGRISVGAPELVCADNKMPFVMDGSMATLRQPDGSVRYWETDGGYSPYYNLFLGTTEDPFLTEEEPFAWDYNGYERNLPSNVWVQNLYQCEDGTLIGFIHREDLIRGNTATATANDYFIGLAISTDGGRNWRYGGDVLSTVQNGDDVHSNMGGVPYLVVDGYFYIYYNEFDETNTRYTSVARCSVTQTVEALRDGRLPLVEKYAGDGSWGIDGMTGTGAVLVKDSYGSGYDTHSDAAYCAPLGRYLLTLQTHEQSALLLLQSDDGLNWDDYEPIVLDQAEAGTVMQPYSFFVGLTEEASNDFSTVGSQFYLYFPRKSLSDYGMDDLHRVKVTITD